MRPTDTAAGLLRNMGYEARAVEGWIPPPGGARPCRRARHLRPAIVRRDGQLGSTAEDPEAHLPVTTSQRLRRAAPGKAGDPQYAWWL